MPKGRSLPSPRLGFIISIIFISTSNTDFFGIIQENYLNPAPNLTMELVYQAQIKCYSRNSV
jgi:hypothetical protein